MSITSQQCGKHKCSCEKSEEKNTFSTSASILLLKLGGPDVKYSFDTRNIIFLALRALGETDSESIFDWVTSFQRWSGVEVVTKNTFRKAMTRGKEKEELHVMSNGKWCICKNKQNIEKRLQLEAIGKKIQDKFCRGKQKIQELLSSGGKLLELSIEYENALETYRDTCFAEDCEGCNIPKEMENFEEEITELLQIEESILSNNF